MEKTARFFSMHRDNQKELMIPKNKMQIDSCLKGIAKGKTNLVDVLYDLVQARLFFVALKYMGDKDKAEDVMSDFWGNIEKIARKYTFFSNAFSYLCKVVANMSITSLKKEGVKNKREMPITAEFLERYEGFCDDVFRSERDQSLRDVIQKGFSSLDEREKVIVYLTYWEEKTVRECAASIGVSKSTADRIKFSAMQKLKKVLEGEGWDKTDL